MKNTKIEFMNRKPQKNENANIESEKSKELITLYVNRQRKLTEQINICDDKKVLINFNFRKNK